MKRYLKGIGFILAFAVCGLVFHYLLVDDTRSYTRLMMHEFYGQDNIDILFSGSSHCYGSLDPALTDPVFNANTFNSGSALQAQDASFALIREAVEHNHVQQVFMELYYFMMENDEYRDREQLTGTYIISDYMRPSLNKVRFLLEASAPKYYINSFLPPRRNWEALLHPSQVLDIVRKKQTAEYLGYVPFDGYRTKGFVANDGVIGNGGLLLDTAGFDRIHTEQASADWLRTVREIIEYCNKKGVRLTLFSSPMTLFQTAGAGNYDEYIAFVNKLTEGTGVRYVDFNLCKEAYFDQTPDLFADAGHMNGKGAEKFSRLFAEYFTGAIPDEDLFYGSMEEKIAAHGPDILGLSFLDSGDGTRKMKIVSTMEPGTRFTAVLLFPDGRSRQLLNNSPDLFFEISGDEHGIIRIEADGISAEIGV